MRESAIFARRIRTLPPTMRMALLPENRANNAISYTNVLCAAMQKYMFNLIAQPLKIDCTPEIYICAALHWFDSACDVLFAQIKFVSDFFVKRKPRRFHHTQRRRAHHSGQFHAMWCATMFAIAVLFTWIVQIMS